MINPFKWKRPFLYRPDSLLCDWLVICCLTAVCMLVLIDLLASVVVQYQMQGHLSIDSTKTVWIGKAFFFFAAIAPLYAVHMANIYGFKCLFFAGTAIFLVGSTMTAVADNFALMILSRSLAGLGGGVVLAISFSYIAHIIPRSIRDRAIILYSNIFFGMGIALGLLIGGYLGQLYLWKQIFLLSCVIGAPLVLLMLACFPETAKVERPPYDFVSLFCLSLFFFTLLVIVTQVKAPWNTLGWHSPFIFSCWAVVCLSFAAFLAASMWRSHPLIAFDLFRYPRYVMGCLGMVVIGLMIFGATIELMGLLEVIYLYERWTTGFFISTVGFLYFFFGLLPALLTPRIHPRLFVLLGMALITMSCFMHQEITIQSDMWQIGKVLWIRSIGIALVLGPLAVLAIGSVGDELMTKATAFLSFTRLIAATFGSSLIALMIEMRRPFHALRFSEQINRESPRYHQYLQQHVNYDLNQGGVSVPLAQEKTRLLLGANLDAQATIASFNDALYLLGWATAAIFLSIIILMIYRAYNVVNSEF